MSASDRRARLDRNHSQLSVRRQCAMLGLARSGIYRVPRPANDEDVELMRRIDALFTRWPFLGSQRMVALLAAEGIQVNRKRVRRLMRRMGIAALGPKPRTSQPGADHKVYPYLLRELAIERPNQVWCADITYLPLGRGILYLVAIMDWHSRAVLAWRVSNTIAQRSHGVMSAKPTGDVSFCVSALEEALARFGRPEIFNTDQGSQFTSVEFTGVLSTAGIRISMDGKGRWMDNVFIERLWRSLKYEEVYIKAYADGTEARAGIAGWFDFYNERRPHQALGNRAPMQIWREHIHGSLPATAVEMPLRLDNAGALPTSPQPHPQQQAA